MRWIVVRAFGGCNRRIVALGLLLGFLTVLFLPVWSNLGGVPLLEAIIAKPWGKEDELKQFKSDLATLDHKITAELAPHKEEQDGEENKLQPDTQRVEVRDNRSQSNGSKETMVAEPLYGYNIISPSISAHHSPSSISNFRAKL